MKTWIMIASLWIVSPEISWAAESSTEAVVKKGKRSKSGRYKKKKGLFGRKNDCGCPKH